MSKSLFVRKLVSSKKSTEDDSYATLTRAEFDSIADSCGKLKLLLSILTFQSRANKYFFATPECAELLTVTQQNIERISAHIQILDTRRIESQIIARTR